MCSTFSFSTVPMTRVTCGSACRSEPYWMRKMASHYISYEADEDGWIPWVTQYGRTHFIRCCDCALVHEFQFRTTSRGYIQWRCRRDERKTARNRRTFSALLQGLLRG